MERIHNKIWEVVFGLFALAALSAAIFCHAPWHYGTAAVGVAMVAVLRFGKV